MLTGARQDVDTGTSVCPITQYRRSAPNMETYANGDGAIEGQ